MQSVGIDAVLKIISASVRVLHEYKVCRSIESAEITVCFPDRIFIVAYHIFVLPVCESSEISPNRYG